MRFADTKAGRNPGPRCCCPAMSSPPRRARCSSHASPQQELGEGIELAPRRARFRQHAACRRGRPRFNRYNRQKLVIADPAVAQHDDRRHISDQQMFRHSLMPRRTLFGLAGRKPRGRNRDFALRTGAERNKCGERRSKGGIMNKFVHFEIRAGGRRVARRTFDWRVGCGFQYSGAAI